MLARMMLSPQTMLSSLRSPQTMSVPETTFVLQKMFCPTSVPTVWGVAPC
jgi:hypothetical protein